MVDINQALLLIKTRRAIVENAAIEYYSKKDFETASRLDCQKKGLDYALDVLEGRVNGN